MWRELYFATVRHMKKLTSIEKIVCSKVLIPKKYWYLKKSTLSVRRFISDLTLSTDQMKQMKQVVLLALTAVANSGLCPGICQNSALACSLPYKSGLCPGHLFRINVPFYEFPIGGSAYMCCPMRLNARCIYLFSAWAQHTNFLV